MKEFNSCSVCNTKISDDNIYGMCVDCYFKLNVDTNKSTNEVCDCTNCKYLNQDCWNCNKCDDTYCMWEEAP